MGGGGGSRRRGLADLGKLEQIAKDVLRTAEGPVRQNVFLSFATEDMDEVNLLRGQAKNDNSDIEFNDWSLKKPFNSKDAEYIRRGIREKIRQSSLTIVYVSEDTAGSDWVDWEVRESKKLGKRVIAMYQGDTLPSNLPKAITELGIKLVPWNQAELRRAIEGD